MASYIDTAIERAWNLLDRGEPEKALDLMAGVDSNAARRWVVEASAHLELDDLAKARTAIDKASSLGGAAGLGGDVEYLWTRAEICLREWKLAEAEELYGKVAAAERTSAVLERLALLADLRHDQSGADALLAEAEEIDADAAPHPPRLSPQQFEHVLDEAVELLPDEFRAALDGVRVVIDQVPSEGLIDKADCGETPPDMLGLFVGASKLEESPEDSGGLPPVIHLFQRNLERASIDRDELVNEIRITLYHELGHYLGFDEDGVADMGLQ
ncbi:MAG: metallopeptidase family protein [Planctomycetes bacterium]|nr:metallopeptidase family protein [Planctomycetota bacterium]